MIAASESVYWKKTLKITMALLAVWFASTFITSFFARELNTLTFLGFPLGFYMGAQGVLIIYLVIVWFYAYRMERLDDELRAEK